MDEVVEFIEKRLNELEVPFCDSVLVWMCVCVQVYVCVCVCVFVCIHKKNTQTRQRAPQEEKSELKSFQEFDSTRRCLEYTVYMREQTVRKAQNPLFDCDFSA
jgi:hypothetical protein